MAPGSPYCCVPSCHLHTKLVADWVYAHKPTPNPDKIQPLYMQGIFPASPYEPHPWHLVQMTKGSDFNVHGWLWRRRIHLDFGGIEIQDFMCECCASAFVFGVWNHKNWSSLPQLHEGPSVLHTPACSNPLCKYHSSMVPPYAFQTYGKEQKASPLNLGVGAAKTALNISSVQLTVVGLMKVNTSGFAEQKNYRFCPTCFEAYSLCPQE